MLCLNTKMAKNIASKNLNSNRKFDKDIVGSNKLWETVG